LANWYSRLFLIDFKEERNNMISGPGGEGSEPF
jgi:hypothetical protein